MQNCLSYKVIFFLDAMQVCANLHVEILKSPREEETFSTWARNKTSEESNETSEEMIRSYVKNKKYPREDFYFSTWIYVSVATYFTFCAFFSWCRLPTASTAI